MRSTILAIAIASLLAACGGGGGGGGGGTEVSSNSPSGSGSAPLGEDEASGGAEVSVTVAESFPLGAAVVSPADLIPSGAQGASFGGQAMPAANDSGLDRVLWLLNSIRSTDSYSEAVDRVRTVFNPGRLVAAAQDSPCYAGMTISRNNEFVHHDDLPAGVYSGNYEQSLRGILSDSDANGVPCALAQVRAATASMSDSTLQGLAIVAMIGRANDEITRDWSTLIPPGLDQRASVTALIVHRLRTDLAHTTTGAHVDYATFLAQDSESADAQRLPKKVSITFRASTGRPDSNGQFVSDGTSGIEIRNHHFTNGETGEYRGIMVITVTRFTATAGFDTCRNEITTANPADPATLYKVSDVQTVHYSKTWTAAASGAQPVHRARVMRGRYCGHGNPNADNLASTIAARDTVTFELDAAKRLEQGFLPTRLPGQKGWVGTLAQYAADYNSITREGSFTWARTLNLPAIMGLAADVQDRTEVLQFVVTQEGKAIQAFAGTGGPISQAPPSIEGMLCNGTFGNGVPEVESVTAGSTQVRQIKLVSGFQSQRFQGIGGLVPWQVPEGSRIRFAPTTTCNSSTTMRFDADRDGNIAEFEGASVSADLDRASGGRSIASEIDARGFSLGEPACVVQTAFGNNQAVLCGP